MKTSENNMYEFELIVEINQSNETTKITKNKKFYCKILIIGTGLSIPRKFNMRGAEYFINYVNMSTDSSFYQNKRVLIAGGTCVCVCVCVYRFFLFFFVLIFIAQFRNFAVLRDGKTPQNTKRIIKGGNSGWEAAKEVSNTAAYVHLLTHDRKDWAYHSHYVGKCMLSFFFFFIFFFLFLQL